MLIKFDEQQKCLYLEYRKRKYSPKPNTYSHFYQGEDIGLAKVQPSDTASINISDTKISETWIAVD